MKKKLLLISVIVICLSTLAFSTIAYFTAEEIAHNVITSGEINIAIIEKTKGEGNLLLDFPEEGLSGVMPGSSCSKIVSVLNNGTADAYIRVKVTEEITSVQGDVLPVLLSDGTPVMTFSIKNSDWTEKDGWYYYNAPVAPEATTEILFDRVQFSPEMGNAYQGSKANLSVYVQAVQVANNGNTALDATGWPSEVSE